MPTTAAIVIATLTDVSSIIILEFFKLGYSLSAWSDNKAFAQAENGIGGLTALSIKSEDVLKTEDLHNKLKHILQTNNISYFGFMTAFHDGSAHYESGWFPPKEKPVDMGPYRTKDE